VSTPRNREEPREIELYESFFVNKKEDVKVIFKYERDLLHTPLAEASLIQFKKQGKLYFLMKWERGAHGQEIYIVDLENKKFVFHHPSSWPMHYQVNENEVIAIGRGDMGENGVPLKRNKTWKP